MTRNLAASVRDRLKQHADAGNEDFNLTLNRYGLERLLYRLSVSLHAPNFLLKGALLFSLWYDHPTSKRPPYGTNLDHPPDSFPSADNHLAHVSEAAQFGC